LKDKKHVTVRQDRFSRFTSFRRVDQCDDRASAGRPDLCPPLKGGGRLPLSGLAYCRGAQWSPGGHDSVGRHEDHGKGDRRINQENRTFSMIAKEIGGQTRTATIDGQIEDNGWITAKIKGPQGTCNALVVPIFAVPPGTK
jgi:hypothetical protein